LHNASCECMRKLKRKGLKVAKFSIRKDTMQTILGKMHEQKDKWTPHGKKKSTWAIFCVNDESKVDVKVPQIMCRMLCYSRLVGHA